MARSKVYRVTVVEKQTCSLVIRAKNKKQAEEIALELVSDSPGDYFDPDWPDYDTGKVEEVKDTKGVEIDNDDCEEDED